MTESKLLITSAWPTVAGELAARFAKAGWRVQPSTEPTDQYRLCYGPEFAMDRLSELRELLDPFQPAIIPDDALGPDAHLQIGDAPHLSNWRVELKGDSQKLIQQTAESLSPVGIQSDSQSRLEAFERPRILFGGAPPAVRHLISWKLGEQGFRFVESKEWSDDDTDIYIELVEPNVIGRPPKERHRIHVFSDDQKVTERAIEKLDHAGFKLVETHDLSTFDDKALMSVSIGSSGASLSKASFSIAPGPLEDTLAAASMMVALGEVYQELDVDETAFPLHIEESEDIAWVLLPINIYRAGKLRPYAGSSPARFSLRIDTDEPEHEVVTKLREMLEEQGFSDIEVRNTSEDSHSGFYIRWGAAGKETEVATTIRDCVEQARTELGVGPELPLTAHDDFSKDDSDVRISIPIGGIADGSLIERVNDPSRFRCKLWVANPENARPLSDALATFGFASFEVGASGRDDSDIQIVYGAAPEKLLDGVQELIGRFTGAEVKKNRRFSSAFNNVWIRMGNDVKINASKQPHQSFATLSSWIAGEDPLCEPASIEPFIRVSEGKIRMGNVTLQRRPGSRHRLVPPESKFSQYTLDGITAETLVHLAKGVMLGEPCLLEGETSTSKTSSIEYLACLLNQPVIRVSLNGQTDTGDLIGRYVPQALGQQLPFMVDDLLETSVWLEPETREILATARDEGRALTALEIQRVMANERMNFQPWRWLDGPIVQGLRQGWWVILDELNLAEPQILERLNSLLERDPSLILIEHDGTTFGPGGHAVSPEFRIFATMNPANYAGRTVMSPSYRNRWRGSRVVPTPGEVEYLAMLRRSVYGDQPDITVQGSAYRGERSATVPHAALADIPYIEELLPALARFHVSLEHITGQRSGSKPRIGLRRKERHVFTRRDLISVLDFLASPTNESHATATRTFRAAIMRYYLGRMSSEEDRMVVIDLLNATGIGPGAWTIGAAAKADEEADYAKDGAAEEPNPDPELDLMQATSELQERLDDLLTDELPNRLRILSATIKQFERPNSKALDQIDSTIKNGRGVIEDTVEAFKACKDEVLPWVLAALVQLAEKDFPKKPLKSIVNRLKERVGSEPS